MTDPAEIRAEGRRLLAQPETDWESERELEALLRDHADVLLADPVPVDDTKIAGEAPTRKDGDARVLTDVPPPPPPAPVDDRERVPEGWRVEWPLSASGRPFRPRLVPVSPSVDPKEEG